MLLAGILKEVSRYIDILTVGRKDGILFDLQEVLAEKGGGWREEGRRERREEGG